MLNRLERDIFLTRISKNIIKYNLDFVIRGSGLLIEHGELLNIEVMVD